MIRDLELIDDITEDDLAFDTPEFPDDYYVVCVTASEDGPNKALTGHNLMLTFQVVSGTFKGTTFSTWLAYDNPSPKAVASAKKKISLLCKVLGVKSMNIPDAEKQFLNKVVSARVETVTRDGNKSVEVKSFRTTGVGEAQHAEAKAEAAKPDDDMDGDIPF